MSALSGLLADETAVLTTKVTSSFSAVSSDPHYLLCVAQGEFVRVSCHFFPLDMTAHGTTWHVRRYQRVDRVIAGPSPC